MFIIGIALVVSIILAYYFLKPCEENCGKPNNPVKKPLPKCKKKCYTSSKAKNALKSCEENCGHSLNPAKVPIPKCKKHCYTTSKDKESYNNCRKFCGSEKYPVL